MASRSKTSSDASSRSIAPKRMALRMARIRRRWSLSEAAAELHWSPSKLSRIERGILAGSTRDIEHLRTVYGLTPDELDEVHDEWFPERTPDFPWASLFDIPIEEAERQAREYLRTSRYEDAFPLIEYIGSRATTDQERATCSRLRGARCLGIGALDKAERHLNAAAAFYESVGDDDLLNQVLNNLSLIATEQGLHVKALAFTSHVIDKATNPLRLAVAKSTRARAGTASGAVSGLEAETLFAQAREHYLEADDDRGAAWCEIHRFGCILERHPQDELAHRGLEQAVDTWGPDVDPIDVDNYCRAAGLLAVHGRSSRASRLALLASARRVARAAGLQTALRWLRNLAIVTALVFTGIGDISATEHHTLDVMALEKVDY